MLLIGAKGHAKEVLDVLTHILGQEDIALYDDVSSDLPERLYGKFPVIKTVSAVKQLFLKDNRFVLALGNPHGRADMARKFRALGGELISVISPFARIGALDIELGNGLNVMHGVVITNSIKIGEGTLLNANCTVHHDSRIGNYCEISPGAHITGKCTVGNFCRIGTGAVVLPGVKIGDNVIIGAGAVVRTDVESNCTVVGVPAKSVTKRSR